MLSQEEARRLFDYNPDSGELTWKVSLNGRAPVGAKAGCLNANGYLLVLVYKKSYRVHRLIWLWVHGYFPEHQVDHINRDRLDNRLVNLREVTQQCNLRNAKQQINNTSGVTGVSWEEKRGEWRAQIKVNSQLHYLGRFEDFTEAALHRLAAEQCLDWQGCNSNSDAYKFLKENRNGTKTKNND